MNATNDLVLSVLANYGWDKVEAFATSVARSGFRGRKILLVWNLDTYTRARLTERGFELVDVAPANMKVEFGAKFFRHRDKLAYEFLYRRWREFRFVLWLDIHDLVVQSDPSAWLESNLGEKKLVVASESILIKDEGCNDSWLKNTVDTETWLRVRECEVLNAGTVAGTAERMRDLFAHIFSAATKTNDIAEQAALNAIVRSPPFDNITVVPTMRDNFAIVGYGCNPSYAGVWGDNQPVLRDGVLYPKDSAQPFCIVHQYDRNPQWKDIIDNRYK